MPYSTVSELPKAVKEKYSEHQQDAFLKAFNSAVEQYGDESKAFAVAHAAAKRAGKKKPVEKAAVSPDLDLNVESSVIFEQVNGPVHFDIVAQAEGDILVFKNAVLARAETNKNGDSIDETGIAELAATIAGRPIDFEHQVHELRGVFTAGRPYNETELSTDGFIWADRYPEDAEGVQNGEYGLSIEATALKAKCSKCGGEYSSASEYCSCLKERRKFGTNRILSGLKAKGGAITRNPAASSANFNPAELYFVASHQEESMEDEFILLLASDADILFKEAISKREDVSPADKERAVKEYGDVKYADEKNKKYPIDTEAHIRSAYNYISQAKNAAKYSPEEAASIKRKIVAAWKDKISKEGPPSAAEASADTEDVTKYPESVKEQQEKEEKKKEEQGRGEDTENTKKETPMEDEKKEKEVGVEASAEEQLKARIAELEAAMDSMKKDMDKKDEELSKEKKDKEAADVKCKELEAKVAEESKKATELEAKLVEKILASKFSDTELPAMKEKVSGWRLDQIELLASTVSPAAPRRTEVPTSFGTPSGGAAAQPAKKRITLE